MKNSHLDEDEIAKAELERLREVISAQKSPQPERSLSAMELIVDYRIGSGHVTHTARDEDHVFDLEIDFVQEYEKKPINAFSLRDEFLSKKGWSGAWEFLSVSGPFSPISERITLKEFERWQEYTKLVLVKKTREALSSSLRSGDRNGEYAEALKALTGLYDSSFFDGVLEAVHKTSPEWKTENLTPEQCALVVQCEIENNQRRVKRLKALCAWFRTPPAAACSIRWVPNGPEAWNEAVGLLKAGRVLLDAEARPSLEFSLPREALKPVMVIEARCSLQAIAASVYADYWHGVEHRRCRECGKVFRLGTRKRVGRWQEKEHCSEKCKQSGVNQNRPKSKKHLKRTLTTKKIHTSATLRNVGKV
jgi:hypothetical protein